MKRKILALTLVFALVLSVGLTACGGKSGGSKDQQTLAGPDEVAVALFDLLLKNDASGAQKALGYASEEAVRADFMGENGEDLYEVMADQLVSQFEQLGVTVSDEDSQLLLDAMLTMMGKLELTAKVKESSEKDKKAVVTCTVTTVDLNAAMEGATEQAMAEALSDPALANDMDALVSAIIKATATAMKDAQTGEPSAPFDVEFSLQKAEVDGKTQSVWVPTDAQAFGAAISRAAIGG